MQFLYLQSFDRLLTYLCFLAFVTGGLIKLLVTVPLLRFTFYTRSRLSACLDLGSCVLIELFECQAASSVVFPASVAICLYDVSSFHFWLKHTPTLTLINSTMQSNSNGLLGIIAVLFWNIFRAACLLTMAACLLLSQCVLAWLCCLFPKDINLTDLLRILHWKWNSGQTYFCFDWVLPDLHLCTLLFPVLSS